MRDNKEKTPTSIVVPYFKNEFDDSGNYSSMDGVWATFVDYKSTRIFALCFNYRYHS